MREPVLLQIGEGCRSEKTDKGSVVADQLRTYQVCFKKREMLLAEWSTLQIVQKRGRQRGEMDEGVWFMAGRQKQL